VVVDARRKLEEQPGRFCASAKQGEEDLAAIAGGP